MKIGLIVFARKDNGGVFQFTQSVIQSLKLGKDPLVIFIPEEHGKESLEQYQSYQCEVRTFRLGDFRIFLKLNVVLSSFFPWIPILKRDFQQFNDIDLIYATTPSFFPLAFLKKKSIVTIHDLQERYYPQFFTVRERLKRWILNRVMKRVATRFLVESSFVKNDLVKFVSIDPNRIFVNPAPANLANLSFTPDPALAKKVKEKYALPETYIYYPAQFWPHKNHKTLLSAFQKILVRFPQCTLVFSGSKQNYFDEVMDHCAELKLQNHVKYLGYVENAEMPYLFKAATIVAMPSLFESISIPIIEAFCLGVPVVSAKTCALPEQVGDAGFLFDATNPDDLASKILELLQNPEMRADLIEKGKERVKRYSSGNFLESFRKNSPD